MSLTIDDTRSRNVTIGIFRFCRFPLNIAVDDVFVTMSYLGHLQWHTGLYVAINNLFCIQRSITGHGYLWTYGQISYVGVVVFIFVFVITGRLIGIVIFVLIIVLQVIVSVFYGNSRIHAFIYRTRGVGIYIVQFLVGFQIIQDRTI